MKILSIVNQKGGVGKTTTALAIGEALAKRFKVLFVDLDPQGNLSYVLNADTSTGGNVLIALQQPHRAQAELQLTPTGFNILASAPSLTGADALLTEVGKEYKLKEALDGLKGEFDYCIIDTPPALGILSVNALTASNGLIIPAQADILSLQGISQLFNTITPIKKYTNPGLEVLGIVLTRFNPRTIITKDLTTVFESTASQLGTKVFKTRIREATAIKEAQALKEPLLSYAPKSKASKDYIDLAKEIEESIKHG